MGVTVNLDCEVVSPTKLTDLTDVPNDYAGESGKVLKVNNAEDGMEFVESSSSGVNSVTGDGVDDSDPENPVLSYPSPNDIGLGSVNNTSDIDKPISDATQVELDTKIESLVAGSNVSIDDSDPLNPIVSATSGSDLTASEIEGLLNAYYGNSYWRDDKPSADTVAAFDVYFGSTTWRTGVAGATLVAALEYANNTDGVTSKGVFNYINNTPALKNQAINGNCDLDGAPVNWYAGASSSGGNPDNATIYDIPNPSKSLINLNATRGFIILEGDNNDSLRVKTDSFPMPTAGNWVKMSFYVFVEAGDYSPTSSSFKIRAFRDGAAVYDITTNLSVTRIDEGLYRIDGFGHLDFTEDVTDLWFEYKWIGVDIRPSGDVYTTGFSISESEESPNFTIIDNFVVGGSKRSQYNLIEQNRAKLAPFFLKYLNKEVDEYNQVNMVFTGNSITGRQNGTDMSNSAGEATGNFPVNMWQQLFSYKVLEALQYDDADVQYYNMSASEITESGSWSEGVSNDGIRTRLSTTIGNYFEITITDAAYFKMVFFGNANLGATFNVLVNGILPSVEGITGDDTINTSTHNTSLKWGYVLYKDLDPDTSYTFRFTKTNTTNTSIWGCEAWNNPRINVINNGNGGQVALNHKIQINKFSSLEYNPSICIHELPTINDSYDVNKYIGFRDPDSAGFSPTGTEQFFEARSTGTYVNYDSLELLKGEYGEYNGAAWVKGSTKVNSLLTDYNNNIDYLNMVSENGVPTMVMTPHRTVSYANRSWQQLMTKICRTWANKNSFAFIDIDYKYSVEDLNVTDRVVADGTHLNDLGVETYASEIIAVLDPTYDNGLGYEGYKIKIKAGTVGSADSRTVVFDNPYLKTPKIKIQAFDDGASPSFQYIESSTNEGFVVNGTGAFTWEAWV